VWRQRREDRLLKGAFNYCDCLYSGLTDAHLDDPADFWGAGTNKMFILTQVANPDALHCGNLVTWLGLSCFRSSVKPVDSSFDSQGDSLHERLRLCR
jgi:hypothetical protein